MSEKKKIIIESIICGGAIIAVMGGFIAHETIIGYNTPESYKNNTIVEYNGEDYYLKELYKLTSDKETHLCILEKKSKSELGLGLTPDGKVGVVVFNTDQPMVYVDINSKQQIAIAGYENIFGYNVEKVIDYFPFEEYGNRDRVVISQEKVDEVIGTKGNTLKNRI